ncbi:MAG: CHRD domain-containing protein [Opitutus sp.]
MKITSHVRLILAAGSFAVGGLLHASPVYFNATLSGPAEGNASPGTGQAWVTYDPSAHTLQVNATFTGLTGTTTASHIHAATAVPGAGTAGVATQVPNFPGFPLGVTSGTYQSATFDLTLLGSWNPAFVTAHGGTAAGAEDFFAAALWSGSSYFNIHTSTFGGGEIRGFLHVPDAAQSASLLLLGLASLIGLSRIRLLGTR